MSVLVNRILFKVSRLIDKIKKSKKVVHRSSVNGQAKIPGGGEFLTEDLLPEFITTPEDCTEDHHMMRGALREFMNREVFPKISKMEEDHDRDLVKKLIKQLGDLGIFGVDFPEEEGGLGRDRLMALVVAEELTRYEGLAVSVGAHAGIGTWPLKLFGTKEQKEKYLAKLLSGEMIAAYALTEPQAGSDAMAIKTTATPTEDGTAFILNGEKMWITNGGIADIFTVYARIPGSDKPRIAAFLVPSAWEGVKIGKDEKKTGLWGSSTTAVSFTDVRTPQENLLGELGRGHKIAFNVLNLGRFKLAAGCVGTLRVTLEEASKYALERKAFGRSIASFGAIREMLANMAVRLFVGESSVYRLAGDLGRAESSATSEADAIRKIEQYSAECAMLKVWLSEAAYASCDDEVGVFGGYGYSREYPADRRLRDSRVNRIFEGTNEINKMLAVGTLLGRAMKNEIALLPAFAESLPGKEFRTTQDHVSKGYEDLYKLLLGLKRITIYLLGKSAEKYMTNLKNEQEVLARLSVLFMLVYNAENCLARLGKLLGDKRDRAEDLVRVYFAEAAEAGRQTAIEIMAQVLGENIAPETYAQVLGWIANKPVDVIALKRKIAQAVLEDK